MFCYKTTSLGLRVRVSSDDYEKLKRKAVFLQTYSSTFYYSACWALLFSLLNTYVWNYTETIEDIAPVLALMPLLAK